MSKKGNNVLPEIVVNGVNFKNKSPWERAKYKASGKPLYWTNLPIEYRKGFDNIIYPYTTTIGTDHLGNKFEVPTSTDKRQADLLASNSFARASGRITDLTPETALAVLSLGTGSGRKLIKDIAKGAISPVTNPAKAFWKGGIKAGAESALKEVGMLAGGIAGSEVGGKIGNQINSEYGSIIGSLIGSLPGGYLGRKLGNTLNPKVQNLIDSGNENLIQQSWFPKNGNSLSGNRKYLIHNLLNYPKNYKEHFKVYNMAKDRGRLSIRDAIKTLTTYPNFKMNLTPGFDIYDIKSHINPNEAVMGKVNYVLNENMNSGTTDDLYYHYIRNAFRMRNNPDDLRHLSYLVDLNEDSLYHLMDINIGKGEALDNTGGHISDYLKNRFHRHYENPHKFSKMVNGSIRNFERILDKIDPNTPFPIKKSLLNLKNLNRTISQTDVGSPGYQYIKRLLHENGIKESDLPEFDMSDYVDINGFNLDKFPIFSESTNVPITRAFSGTQALIDALKTRKIRSTFNNTIFKAENEFTVNKFMHSGVDGGIPIEGYAPEIHNPMHIRLSPEEMSPNYAVGYKNPYFTSESTSGVGGNDFMFVLGRKGFPEGMGVRQVHHGGTSSYFISDYGYDTKGRMLSDRESLLPHIKDRSNKDKMDLFQVSPFQKINSEYGIYRLPSLEENDLIFSKNYDDVIIYSKAPGTRVLYKTTSPNFSRPSKIGFIDSDILSRLKPLE